MHYSYLNASYNNNVNNDWDSGGCIDVIRRSLGYRFVLVSADLPGTVKINGVFSIKMNLQNKGFASPYNPRPLQIVLRNQSTKAVTIIPLTTDIRKWFPGNIVCQESLTLPKSIQPGSYEVLLNLPDAYSSLAGRSAYSIRLANEDVWEQETGYNELHHTIAVQP